MGDGGRLIDERPVDVADPVTGDQGREDAIELGVGDTLRRNKGTGGVPPPLIRKCMFTADGLRFGVCLTVRRASESSSILVELFHLGWRAFAVPEPAPIDAVEMSKALAAGPGRREDGDSGVKL